MAAISLVDFRLSLLLVLPTKACYEMMRCSTGLPRRLARRAFSTVDYAALRGEKSAEIAKLAESIQADNFTQTLADGSCQPHASSTSSFAEAGMSNDNVMTVLEAGMATFALHIESRVSSMLGQGFYTIGPCGEELVGALGVALRQTDPMALHYRHLSATIARQLAAGRSVDDILFDRAKG
jgi:2-oxoisovalerate dehydrogenase E1 component